MAKKESTLLSMSLTLLVITAVSAASLGFMYELTKEPKAAAELQKQNFAIMAVLPAFDNSPSEDAFAIETFDGQGEQLICYPATKDGELVGIAVRTWTMTGYSGLIRIMVGFDQSGNIINTSVLEHQETPGLGTKMAEPPFKDQFMNKNPAKNNIALRRDGGEIDGITAATITARAFSDAVMRAHRSLDAAGKFE